MTSEIPPTFYQFLQELKIRADALLRPSVTLSYAQTLGGAITLQRGHSTSLSSLGSMKLTHLVRSFHAGILVGVGTILADDPSLTVRLVEGKQPRPVILDTNLRTPLVAKIWEHPVQPLIFAGSEVSKKRAAQMAQKGAELVFVHRDSEGKLLLSEIMAGLKNRGIITLMVEGGAEVISSFYKNRVVDQVVLTLAPYLVGGYAPYDYNYQTSVDNSQLLQHSAKLSKIQSAQIGEDIVIWGKVTSSGEVQL